MRGLTKMHIHYAEEEERRTVVRQRESEDVSRYNTRIQRRGATKR